ncbi:hypothetical protein [Schumannella soli]|uniref:Uncharacterized protein n=1 Tax=Schumannella soli TaxID=2590779 RepID=A0A506XZF0_9MICO|nr:hypothetical protein [Schumannella soli]TPW74770.1 hypothetical protein FJ657_14435 [Schumannella soli]
MKSRGSRTRAVAARPRRVLVALLIGGVVASVLSACLPAYRESDDFAEWMSGRPSVASVELSRTGKSRIGDLRITAKGDPAQAIEGIGRDVIDHAADQGGAFSDVRIDAGPITVLLPSLDRTKPEGGDAKLAIAAWAATVDGLRWARIDRDVTRLGVAQGTARSVVQSGFRELRDARLDSRYQLIAQSPDGRDYINVTAGDSGKLDIFDDALARWPGAEIAIGRSRGFTDIGFDLYAPADAPFDEVAAAVETSVPEGSLSKLGWGGIAGSPGVLRRALRLAPESTALASEFAGSADIAWVEPAVDRTPSRLLTVIATTRDGWDQALARFPTDPGWDEVTYQMHRDGQIVATVPAAYAVGVPFVAVVPDLVGETAVLKIDLSKDHLDLGIDPLTSTEEAERILKAVQAGIEGTSDRVRIYLDDTSLGSKAVPADFTVDADGLTAATDLPHPDLQRRLEAAWKKVAV